MALIRPFIPARDFALSQAFYTAIGFTTLYRGEDLAILDHDGAGILIQDYYVQAWAENCMCQLFVADLDDWWHRTVDLVERFAVQPPRAPTTQPHGMRVGFLFDPSGVLWQVSEPPAEG